MRLRDMERLDAVRALHEDVAAGLHFCGNCGNNVAEFVTTEGILCRPCHVELIGPVEGEDDDA